MFDMETTHYLVDDGAGPVAGGKPSDKGMFFEPQRQRIACQPFASKVQCMLTTIASSVNCPSCRSTEEWKTDAEKCGKPELRVDAIPKKILDSILASQAKQAEQEVACGN